MARWGERDWKMSTIHPGMRYPGPILLAPKKDAKYTLLSDGGNYGVVLRFQTGTGTKKLTPTKEHPKLVAMVNKIKEDHKGGPGGPFLINEYHHVVVPTKGGDYLFAGTYETLLEFPLGGGRGSISARAPKGLKPGDIWPGPRVGSKYKLTAGGDISYETEISPGVIKSVCLTNFHTEAEVHALTSRLLIHKGRDGGRIYINEASEFFAPVAKEFLYLGCLGEDDGDKWFPVPAVDGP